VPKREWETGQAEDRLLGMGRLQASNEELKFILARVRAALESGRLEGRERLLALDQEQAILDELLDREARAAEAALGLAPRKVARARRKSDWTVEELYAADLPKPKWIVPELLPTGLASLAGRPKLGKSWLALQLAAAVASGGRFLEREVEDGPVLFIALEDPPRRLRERLRCLRVEPGVPIRFYTEWPPLSPGAGGLEDLHHCLTEWQPRLVVIDTLARAFGRRIEWNSVRCATAALAGLQVVALEHDCCVLAVDHHRKPGALHDVIDDILGSTGKAAVIDTAWGLYKDRDKQSATLKVTGRDIDERELAVQFDGSTSCWWYVGEVDRPVRTEAEELAYKALEELGEADAGTLARELGKHRVTVREMLRRLETKGYVGSKVQPARKDRGKKVLFYILDEDTTEPSEPTQ
jgi:DNA invertase Pin-like site-specific DNA recombinase